MNRWLRVLLPSAFVAHSTGLAFLWGDFLMGESMGWWFAVQAACGAGLVVWCLVIAKRASLWRDAAVAALTLRIVVGLVFPTLFQPTCQKLIDQRATQRLLSSQLNAILPSDPAFDDVSISVSGFDLFTPTIRGSLPCRADVDRLRRQIYAKHSAICMYMGACQWDVRIQQSDQKLSGCDNDLFPVSR
jgi:hypothetical protein